MNNGVIKSLGDRVFNWVSKRGRYVGVGVIFMLAVLYNVGIADVKEKKESKKDNEKKEEVLAADLNRETREQVYENAINSAAGDAYRFSLRAQSDGPPETLSVYLRGDGNEEKAGEIALTESESPQYYEVTFFTNDTFRDIVVARSEMDGDASKDEWDDTEVFLSGVSISRISVKNEWEMTRLTPTIFGGEEDTKDVTRGTIIQDMGDLYRFSFSPELTESSVDAVYQSSDGVKFDEDDEAIVTSRNAGSSYSYKLNTVYPIMALHLLGEGTTTAKDALVVEYSFDEKEWKEIPYTQKKSEVQKFSGAIVPDETAAVVFVRIRYEGKDKKNKFAGVRNMTVTGTLTKDKSKI